MKTIYKYPIYPTRSQILKIPFGARILSVQVVENQPVIYALVDSEKEPVPFTFFVFGTGWDLEEGKTWGSGLPLSIHYVGTFQQPEEKLVWHVFYSQGAMK